MRLADFILRDMGVIVERWEAFAATQLPAAADMNSLALRDHAAQILEAVAKDLSTAQTREAQTAKSHGLAPRIAGASETAAQTHALLRARSGFNINQLAAEYRALRATVLRLWADAYPHEVATDPEDTIRFNEAIDQALAESIRSYSTQVEQARNLVLGMLGHDMRSPLQTIQMTSRYLSALNAGGQISEAASRLINSGARMQALLDDLLDYSRTALGLGIRIAPSDVDLGALFADVVHQLRASHPHHPINLEVAGNCRGAWDGPRLQRLLDNLVLNAIKYGGPDPVHVVVTGAATEVRVEVRNRGSVIDPSTLAHMFEPLKRGLESENRPDEGSLGLGLYIAHEIALAHGGAIDVRSDQTGTVFDVRLPRQISLGPRSQ